MIFSIMHCVFLFSEHPLSLQSCCRLVIRNQFGPHRVSHIKNISIKDVETDESYALSPNIVNFLEYRELFLTVGQLPETDLWNNSSHSSAIKRLGNVIGEVYHPCYVKIDDIF